MNAPLAEEFLEPYVLDFNFSKLGNILRLHAAKAGTPLVECRLTKAAGKAKFFYGPARGSLFQEADDLLIGKSE